MQQNTIEDNEILYRAVKINPIFWSSEHDRISSALFKDSKGVSVDRDGGRLEKDIILSYEKRFSLKAIVLLKAIDCKSIPVYLKPDKSTKNVYHSLIQDSIDIIEISSSSKLKKLVKFSVLVKKYP